MKKPKHLFLCLLIGAFLHPKFTEAQCSMCRAVLASEEGQKTAQGINDGIVYLMAMPYILVAVVGFVVYRMINKS